MRILHLLQEMNLEQGGVVRAVLDMTTALAQRGHDVVVLTHDERDRPKEWIDGAPGTPRVINLGPITGKGKRLTAAQAAQADKLVGETEMVHLHGAWKLANNQIVKACQAHGVPYALSCHGMLDDWSMAQRTLKKRVYLALGGRATLENAAAIHCTAEAEKTQASRWLGRNTAAAVVAPYVTDLSAYETLPGDSLAREAFGLDEQGPPVVLFLSRLHYKKQPETLIHATKLLKDRGTPIRTRFAGVGDDAYVASLQKLIKDLGLTDDECKLLGMVKGDLKLSLYQASDLFALPTSQENFGLVYTEALACGTPIIATRGTDIWRELEASGAADIADATAEGFANAIAERTNDRAALRPRGETGRSYVFEWLEMTKTVERYEEIYANSIAAMKKRASA